jgi:glycosyltransferase involved in cell wall biosynthesis
MTASDIGVLVPVYNRATTVWPTLDSIAAQSRRPKRLIVVDDGSHDGSAESALRWQRERRPGFETHVIRQPNGGVSAARNRGLHELTDCGWVAFLDSDDLWPNDFLERAAAAIENNPQAVAVSADRLFVEDDSEKHYDMAPFARCPALWMLRLGAAISSCSVVRRDLVQEFGGFPEHLHTGEDAALYLPLSLRGTWLHIPGAPVKFIRRSTASSGEEAALSRKFRDNQRRWAEVYASFFAALPRTEAAEIAPLKTIYQLVANRWLRAGDELEAQGYLSDAAQCYARALGWRWTKWENWQLYFRTQAAALASLRKAA